MPVSNLKPQKTPGLKAAVQHQSGQDEAKANPRPKGPCGCEGRFIGHGAAPLIAHKLEKNSGGHHGQRPAHLSPHLPKAKEQAIGLFRLAFA